MNSSNTQIEHLKRMLALEEKRAALQQQLRAMESQLDSLRRQLVAGAPASVQAAPKKRPGRPPKSLTTLAPAAAAPKPAAKAPAAKASAAKAPAAKPGKKTVNARGQLQERILAALKASGSSGQKIKDLAQKFNMPYRNVQVWFATTGKKNKSIKKVGPATYKLVG